jgi:hypothetical protein
MIHFKDTDAYLAYAAQYQKGGILPAMQRHILADRNAPMSFQGLGDVSLFPVLLW